MKIIVLSDIHGWSNIEIRGFSNVLRLDSRKLARINSGENPHRQFMQGGIDKAATSLMDYNADVLVGLSIGGTIAWRAAQRGMKCQKIIALSATRLRYETSKPDCEIKLVYGEKDPFRPKLEWFNHLGVKFKLVLGQDHEFYMNRNPIEI